MLLPNQSGNSLIFLFICIFAGESAIEIAAGRGDQAILGLLLRHYTPEPEALKVALVRGVASGSLACVATLLQCGVQVDHTDEHGRTALFRAVFSGNVGLVELLARNGADVFHQVCIIKSEHIMWVDRMRVKPVKQSTSHGRKRVEAMHCDSESNMLLIFSDSDKRIIFSIKFIWEKHISSIVRKRRTSSYVSCLYLP